MQSLTKFFINVGLSFEHLGLRVFYYHIIINAKKTKTVLKLFKL